MKLLPAIATAGSEDITCEALGVDADQNVFSPIGCGIPLDDGHVFSAVHLGAVTHGLEVPEFGGKFSLHDAVHQDLVFSSPSNELFNGDQLEVVGIAEPTEFGKTCHPGGVLFTDHLADHAGGAQPGGAGEVNGSFGVAGADQHPTFTGPQRDDMPRTGEVGPVCIWICQELDGVRTVSRGDTGAAGVRIHGDGVGGATRILVMCGHGRKIQTIRVLRRHRDADIAGGVPDHEGHQLRSGKFCGEDNITFVLPVFIIYDNNCLAGGDVRDGFLDRIQLNFMGCVLSHVVHLSSRR